MTRIAIIKKEKCKPLNCGWECKRICPVNMTGSDCVYEGDDKKAVIDERLCNGCGICTKHCPYNAIKIINLPDTKNRVPIHQYGKNGFRIFDLPIIQEGTITGIMGRNGIGKTTVINILSNNLKANFGDFNDKNEMNDESYFTKLNKIFKGSVLQTYFNKLRNGEIKVSFKPQQIIDIPKIYKGRVIDLLKKVNESEILISKLSKKFEIDQILERDIDKLSGGELQRVAILASLLKNDANLYILDEITNYLDIYQRINSSKIIKEEISDKTGLIIEHDLIVLDYLVDYIHIMYGEPSAYGMLTGIKNAKVGINIYLEGYSKEENIRFRDKPIVFEKDSLLETSLGNNLLTEWEEFEVSRGDFKLSVCKGQINKGEIIGIIGRNGIGKTTMIDYIAKNGFKNRDEQSSNNEDIVISYKPQLIELSENRVIDELSVFERYNDNFYKIYILEPLAINDIKEKKISELSGGELQRYAIAKTLLKDADIYLFDEPTAFLDIEDRLKVSKIIRNFIQTYKKSAIIIDHDLVFIDYLSDRLLVFSGKPSLEGTASKPLSMKEGMNKFLKDLNITFRREENNKRPRINKEGSVKDKEQKKLGEYYYT